MPSHASSANDSVPMALFRAPRAARSNSTAARRADELPSSCGGSGGGRIWRRPRNRPPAPLAPRPRPPLLRPPCPRLPPPPCFPPYPVVVNSDAAEAAPETNSRTSLNLVPLSWLRVEFKRNRRNSHLGWALTNTSVVVRVESRATAPEASMRVGSHVQPAHSSCTTPMPSCDSRYCRVTLGVLTCDVSSSTCKCAPGVRATIPGLNAVRDCGSYMMNSHPSFLRMAGISRVCMSDCSCSLRLVSFFPVSISHPSASN
mmetsp:Transcript_48049/g.125720  ORF Transcript_48049/g.125720 Transcript_48049/m.125720 type:complete len:258 (+) Transcript_48049:87-860(+)